MARFLLVNAREPEETRAALLEDGRLEEYRCERVRAPTLVGSLYRGTVANLERGIGAAFVDLGIGRNGFLHLSDCPGGGEGRRIDDLFRVGDDVLVQVTRDAVGGKGPVLTADPSLAGRFLVLLPRARAGGVSRRINAGEDKAKLRALGQRLQERAGAGLIVRTAGADRTQRELLRELRALQRTWALVEARAGAGRGPLLLHREGDFVVRALRDLASKDLEAVVVDDADALARAREALGAIEPGLLPALRLHEGVPLFHAYGVEEQVDALHARRVALPGGGSLVFDRTEALVAVDVNSGRTREPEGLEETALRTNLEAADVAARQIRLRDLGGVIAVDFIDLKDPGRTRAVERAFKAALARDRARLRTGRLGPFGIFLLTRQRAGEGTVAAREACPLCGGAGAVPDPLDIALRVCREVAARPPGTRLRARVPPAAAPLVRERCGKAAPAVEVVADHDRGPGAWAVDAV